MGVGVPVHGAHAAGKHQSFGQILGTDVVPDGEDEIPVRPDAKTASRGYEPIFPRGMGGLAAGVPP